MVSTTSIVFPKDVLTPIKGKPSVSSLQILQQELYQNARAIPTTLGGGALGHLGLVMTPAEYILRPNAAVFVIPVAHGVLPAQGPGATAAQLFEVRRALQVSVRSIYVPVYRYIIFHIPYS